MAINIKIDNDQTTGPIDQLVLDESAGVQDSTTLDTGNEAPVTYTAGVWTGINSVFGTYLNGLSLSGDQIDYIVDHGAASSASDFVTVEVTNDEVINNLFFSDGSGNALDGGDEDLVVGMTTLDGEALYLWSFGDFAYAATRDGSGDPVKIVAVFSLKEASDHLTAQVQMVTTEPLLHTDSGDPDDGLDFTDVLNVSASGSLSFNFDGLPSGNFLYAAFGSDSAGLLITGADLNVKESGGPSQVGEVDGGGGKNGDPCDTVNTSQGGVGTSATIGINSQHFVDGNNADGPTGVFTLVTGFVPLESEVPATGTNISEINYDGYINAFGAAFFISQSESGTADFTLSLWRAGGTGGTSPETQLNYIGNQTTDSAILHDDIEVAVATVTIVSGGTTYNWNSSNSGTSQGGITVAISGNDVTVHGMDATDTISWTSMDVAGDAGDGSFNRFSVTALNGSGGFDIGRIDLSQGVTIPAPIGGDLIVQDDGPSPTGDTFIGHVDEDALLASNIDAIDDGDGILGEQKQFSFDQSDLAGLVNAGTDDPASFYLNQTVSGNVTTSGGANILSQGDQVTWKVVSGVVQGVADAGTASERIVFTLGVDDNGTADDSTDDVFTFTLVDQLDHADAAGETANLVIDLTPALAAKDADLDSVDFGSAAPIGMEVENDTPIFTAQIQGGTVQFATGATGQLINNLHGSVGGDDTDSDHESSDNVKQYTFVDFTDAPNSVFADLDGVLSEGGTKITYYSTSVTLDQTAATAVYEITLDQTANSGAGSYTFKVLQPPPFVEHDFDFTDLPSGQNLMGIIAVDKTNVVAGELPDGGLLIFSNNLDINDGETQESTNGTMTNESGTVNTSKGGGPVTIGNTNQAFDHPGEGTFFCYVDNPLSSAVGGLGLTQVTADDADTAQFDGTNEVTTASVEIVQASGSGTDKRPGPAMHIFAYDVNPGDVNTSAESRAFLLDPTAGADEVNIMGVKIYDANHNLIEYRTNLDGGATNDGALAGGSPDSAVFIQFFLDDPGTAAAGDEIYSLIVKNLKANYTVEFMTEGSHDLSLVENVSGSFDIGGFNVKNSVDVPAQDFDFQVQISDYDNDVLSSTLSQFSVHVDGLSL